MINETHLAICWNSPAGLMITRPALGFSAEEIQQQIIPEAVPRTVLEASELPNSWDFRDAWEFNLEAGAILNLEKAREIHRNRIREARKNKFLKSG